jgi:hypothetical protein
VNEHIKRQFKGFKKLQTGAISLGFYANILVPDSMPKQFDGRPIIIKNEDTISEADTGKYFDIEILESHDTYYVGYATEIKNVLQAPDTVIFKHQENIRTYIVNAHGEPIAVSLETLIGKDIADKVYNALRKFVDIHNAVALNTHT